MPSVRRPAEDSDLVVDLNGIADRRPGAGVPQSDLSGPSAPATKTPVG